MVKNRQKPNKKYKLPILFNILDYKLNKIKQDVLFHLSNQTLNKKITAHNKNLVDCYT